MSDYTGKKILIADDEENSVVKLNADGDRLEVSKRAISLAKEKLFN